MSQAPNSSRANCESIDIDRWAVIDEKSTRSIADLMIGAVEKHPADHQRRLAQRSLVRQFSRGDI